MGPTLTAVFLAQPHGWKVVEWSCGPRSTSGPPYGGRGAAPLQARGTVKERIRFLKILGMYPSSTLNIIYAVLPINAAFYSLSQSTFSLENNSPNSASVPMYVKSVR